MSSMRALSIALILAVATFGGTPDRPSTGLIAHEWGTFTSVAGPDGTAVSWHPLAGSIDLPCFVYHFRDPGFKGGLYGTVRMETPVIYFYSPKESTVSVKVDFPKGLITEWYPFAAVRTLGTGAAYEPYVNGGADSQIEWASVHIAPGGGESFPRENRPSHYFAARHTEASPIEVSNDGKPQQEKFLFYRGVANIDPPLSAQVSGNHVVVQNSASDAPSAMILFENRNGSIGFHIARDGETILDRPELNAGLGTLRAALQSALISAGLFPDEAHAMLETWGDSWFEQGARLIYVLPRSSVDSILPLSIQPAPDKIERVFVGRLELITPEIKQEVAAAIQLNDQPILSKYGRFLQPIIDQLYHEGVNVDNSRNLAWTNAQTQRPACR